MKKTYHLKLPANMAPDRAAIEDALFEKLARLNTPQHAPAPHRLGTELRRAYSGIHSSRAMAADWSDIAETLIAESSQMFVVPDLLPL